MADDTVIQPDLIVAARDDFTDRDLPTAPLLAIEVLSPSTRNIDLLLKKERLQRAGCAHYWVIDPDEPSLRAWTLTDDTYTETAHVTGDQAFHATAPITITPTQLTD